VAGKDNSNDLFTKKYTRRNLLKSAGIGGAGLLIGASGFGSFSPVADAKRDRSAKNDKSIVPFYGKHQAGITTEMQNNVYFASLDIIIEKKSDLIDLFKAWTQASEAMTAGKMAANPLVNDYLPPADTGEAAGLSAANLTVTFGIGPGLFIKNGKDRFGLSHKLPEELKDLPAFSLDNLEERWSGGDLCIQACADDSQVAFHAIRNLVRIARGKAVLRWSQEGFQRTKKASPKNQTPRNLFGFKDGTINPDLNNQQELDQTLWVQNGDGPDWLTNGSFLVIRRIQMFIEVWDRTTLKTQEDTFGRKRDSGAPLGQHNEFDQVDLDKKDENGNYSIPETAHVRRARGKDKNQLFRRSYSYSSGMDAQTGTFDAGLLFICFQRKPSKQFIPIQQRLAEKDELNEYISHKGSAIFACLPGIQKGGYIGETLFS
jgi:deferrochelatase/peroxidase EfeB